MLAAVLRFAALDSIPPGIYPDEALNGVEGLRAATTRDFKVFYPTNNGREGLWINLIGIVVKTLGANQFSLRFLSAIVGVLTVLGLFFVTKKLFKSDGVAIIAALFLATSFWHIDFSRIAFRAINVPLLTIWGFYFLLKSFQTPSPKRYTLYATLGGLVFGLGFHTYIAYRVAPLLLFAFFILKITDARSRAAGYSSRRRNTRPEIGLPSGLSPPLRSGLAFIPTAERRGILPEIIKDFRNENAWRFTKIAAIFLATASMVLAPILLYMANHRDDFLKRDGAKIGVFEQANPLKALALSAAKTALMFNVRGDCNWRHNFPCKPQLPFVVGILFLAGIWLSLKTIFKKNAGHGEFFPYAFVLAWFLVFLIPQVLTSEGIPHALRAIGVLPPVMMFAALGTHWVYVWAANNYYLRIARYALPVLVLAAAAIGPYRYFGAWAHHAKTAKEFTQHYVRIAAYIKTDIAKGTPIYVITNEGDVHIDGVSVHAQTVKYLLLDDPGISASVAYSNPSEFLQTPPPLSPGSVIIPLKPDEHLFNSLRNRKLDIMVVSFKDFQVGVVK